MVLRMCCLLLRNAFFAIAHIDADHHTIAFIETTSLKTLVGTRRYMAHFLLVYIWPGLLGYVSFVYIRYDMVSFSG